MRRAGRLRQRSRLPHRELRQGATEEPDRLCDEFSWTTGAVRRRYTQGFRSSLHLLTFVCSRLPDKRAQDGTSSTRFTVILTGAHGDHRLSGSASRPCRPASSPTTTSKPCGRASGRCGRRPPSELGYAIQKCAEVKRYSVVRMFCGHGIGRVFHDAPSVLHYGTPNTGLTLREGMFFTIEPMVNVGRPDVRILADQWTAVTRDRSLSAQFEHTLGVTRDGFEVFTRSPAGLERPIV